jgi:ribosome-binding factor A
MTQGRRPARVADVIRQEIGTLLSRGVVHDPAIGFVTLTRVVVSPDLQLARVYYTSLGDASARRDTAEALERAVPYFRRRIGSRLQLRRIPALVFRVDEAIAHQDRVEQILRELHEEDARRRSPPDDHDRH